MKRVVTTFAAILLTFLANANSNAIIFEDEIVEAICLENWDTDGNGVLSKDEAAAVNSLGTVFNRNENISSFNELQYFTGLTAIDDEAFVYCGGLSSVIIPPNVNRIGERAFASTHLTSVTISNGLKTIGRGAFSACGNLTSITIPSSVTSIEQSAFYASGLTSIEIPSSVTSIENYTFNECFSLTSVKIPNTVTRIGLWAFKDCYNLTSIEIPSSVTDLGEGAFEKCKGLTSVTIPDGVETIGYQAFYGCDNLTSVTIPKSVTSIGSSAFRGYALSSIIIDKGNTVYDSREGCNAIIKTSENKLELGCKNTNIPNGVTSIGDIAFSGCEGLTAVTIPSSVTSIGYLVFSGCPHLESIVVADGNTVYDSREGCNAIIKTSDKLLVVGCTNTTIPDGVKTIGQGAFRGSGIQTLIIPNSVKVIIKDAFFGCNNLKSVSLPEGLETIEEAAFDDCFSLTSINIPSSVKAITYACFAHCNSLTSIIIPNSISSIDSYAFTDCIALNSVIVNRQSPVSINGSVFSNCPNLTLYVPIGCKDAYGSAAVWKDFKEIKEFVRKESTTYSVEEDKSLNVCVVEPTEKKVEIPESVTVDSKTYPVTGIAASAFENNTVIKEVSVPQTIEEIGDEAFAGCTSLSTIYCFADEPIALATTGANARTRAGSQESTTNVFAGVDKVTCLLYVPAGSVSMYKVADGWKDFKYIVGIGTTFVIGNVNGDNVLDENDLNAIINHIMGMPQEGSFDVNMADVNKDDDVNAADVVFLAKMLSKRE